MLILRPVVGRTLLNAKCTGAVPNYGQGKWSGRSGVIYALLQIGTFLL